MKYTKYRLQGPSAVDLLIDRATTNGPFILKNADGLGPPDIDVAITRTQAGSLYSGRTPQNREASFTVGLHPDWSKGQSSADLRHTIYSLLTPRYGTLIKIQLMNDDEIVAEVEGHVRRIEASIFSKDPEVTIYIPCLGPYLEAKSVVYQQPALVVDGSHTKITINNEGNAPSGFNLPIQFVDGFSGTLSVSDSIVFGESLSLTHTFVAGDLLVVSTISGGRGVWKIPSGSTDQISLLGDLFPQSEWLQLHGGENIISINEPALAWTNLQFAHRPAYWGA